MKWSRKLTAERYPRPLSPLGWSNIQAVFDEGVRSFARFMGMPIDAKEQLATSFDGWVVANEDAFDFRNNVKIRLEKPELWAVLKDGARYLRKCPSIMVKMKKLYKFVREPAARKTKIGNALDSLEFHVALGALLAYVRRVSGDLSRSWPGILQSFRDEMKALDEQIRVEDDPRKLLDLGGRLREAMIRFINPDLVIFAVKEIASLCLSEMAVLAGLEEPGEVSALLGSGLDRNVNLSLHRELRETAGVMKTSPQAGEQAMARFLERHGHLTSSWDIKDPTWGEDRHDLLRIMQSVAGSPERSADPLAEERKKCERALFERLKPVPFAASAARELISILRCFMEIDDEHHYHTGRVIPPTRKLVLKLGEALVAGHCLDAVHDIFWLTDAEVREALKGLNSPDSSVKNKPASLARLVVSRKEVYEKAIRDGPPDFSRPRPEPSGNSSPTPAKETRFSGLAIAPGRARGKIRKVADATDLTKVQDGDILLTRSPDPFFSVIFSKIAGLISETGAVLSHGGVLAREYKIPAVFGISRAWEKIPDGATVELDGSSGKVHLP